MEDRRTLRTKRAIRAAFISLATQKEINKITVTELADLADLGRGTFYLHYKDVFDLMEALENEVLSDLAVMSENIQTFNLQPLLEATVGYIWENKDIFALLLSAKGSGLFHERFKAFFKGKHIDVAQNDEAMYSVSYVISGCMGILQEWATGGFSTPPKKLALIMKHIIRGQE